MVFEPDGSLYGVLELGERSMATNVCFGGDAMATLFVTAAKGGRVLTVDGDVPGAAPEAWR